MERRCHKCGVTFSLITAKCVVWLFLQTTQAACNDCVIKLQVACKGICDTRLVIKATFFCLCVSVIFLPGPSLSFSQGQCGSPERRLHFVTAR